MARNQDNVSVCYFPILVIFTKKQLLQNTSMNYKNTKQKIDACKMIGSQNFVLDKKSLTITSYDEPHVKTCQGHILDFALNLLNLNWNRYRKIKRWNVIGD